jgi:Domain of unknown function (DUF4833)
MERTMSMRRAILVGGATLLTGFETRADTLRAQPLFVIARSKNANVVHYEARVRQNGRLDPDEPVVAYWVMRAEDGRREGLTWLERRLAYGFTTSLEAGGEGLRLHVRAFTRRDLSVRRDGTGHFHAEMPIAGHHAWLERIFVASDEHGMTPSVRYIDLLGRLPGDGTRVSERILP